MNVLNQRFGLPWSLTQAMVLSVTALFAMLFPLGALRAEDGDFIILREVPPRTAHRPGVVPGPVRAKISVSSEAAAPHPTSMGQDTGGFAARELTDGQSALVVSGRAGPGASQSVWLDGLNATGTRDGVMAHARPGGPTPYSAVHSLLTGAPGGRGVAGAVGGATGELAVVLNRMAVPAR